MGAKNLEPETDATKTDTERRVLPFRRSNDLYKAEQAFHKLEQEYLRLIPLQKSSFFTPDDILRKKKYKESTLIEDGSKEKVMEQEIDGSKEKVMEQEIDGSKEKVMEQEIEGLKQAVTKDIQDSFPSVSFRVELDEDETLTDKINFVYLFSKYDNLPRSELNSRLRNLFSKYYSKFLDHNARIQYFVESY